jgi:hypothetical protein
MPLRNAYWPVLLVALVGGVAGCAASDTIAADASVVLVDDAGLAPDAPADRPLDAIASADAGPSPADATADGGGPCHSDDDCALVNDCCACAAISRGEKPAACDPKRTCVTTLCAQYQGIDHARCSAGRCVLGFDCDTTSLACKRLAPLCPPGQVPQVVGPPGGRCYGQCVDARQCVAVPACSSCRPTDLCVGAGATGLHCLDPLLGSSLVR